MELPYKHAKVGKVPGTTGCVRPYLCMERQYASDREQERDHLRQLKEQLFAQPPLDPFADPQAQRKAVEVIARALRDQPHQWH